MPYPDGPCYADTVRCSIATDYRKDLPQCCREHLKAIMFAVVDAAELAGVRVALGFGSLLGAVRNPMLGLPAGIIPHDKDGDLVFLGEDWPHLLDIVRDWEGPYEHTDQFGTKRHYVGHALGFEWLYKLPRQLPKHMGQFTYSAGDSIKVRLSSTNHTNVDLFPYYDRPFHMQPDGGRHRYHYVHVDQYKGKDFPEDRLLPLGELEWEGRMLPAPAQPLWFCEHWYGPNWATPVHANNDGQKR